MAVNRRVAAPIIEEAERVEIDTHEFEAIQEAMDTGEPYRLRISLVRDEPQKEEGPTPQE